jgi:hypothetical protein
MISLDILRQAAMAPDPYAEMDRVVRAEMAAGRKVREIFDAINPLVDELLDSPGLTEHGEESVLGVLDALTGMCHPKCQYRDEPATPSQPTKPDAADPTPLARGA